MSRWTFYETIKTNLPRNPPLFNKTTLREENRESPRGACGKRVKSFVLPYGCSGRAVSPFHRVFLSLFHLPLATCGLRSFDNMRLMIFLPAPCSLLPASCLCSMSVPVFFLASLNPGTLFSLPSRLAPCGLLRYSLFYLNAAKNIFRRFPSPFPLPAGERGRGEG
jgi:hypothetical protein